MLHSVKFNKLGEIMKVLIFFVLVSNYLFASNAVEFDCYNSENERVLSIVGLGMQADKLVNIYDNREDFNPNITDIDTRVIAQFYNNGMRRNIHSVIHMQENVELEEDNMTTMYAIIIKGEKRKMRRYSSSSNHQFEMKSINGTFFEGTLKYYVGSSSRRRVIREEFTCQL